MKCVVATGDRTSDPILALDIENKKVSITYALTFYVSLDYLSVLPCNHIDYKDNKHHHELT